MKVVLLLAVYGMCHGSTPSVVIRWCANVVLSRRRSCFVCVSMYVGGTSDHYGSLHVVGFRMVCVLPYCVGNIPT